MAWVAEILRKQHRECARCRMGPTHLYDPDLAELAEDSTVSGKPPETGTPLCNACLLKQLQQDLTAFSGRCILFEPALGPESMLFTPLASRSAAAGQEPQIDSALAALQPLPRDCDRCGSAAARFRWVPVERDANLWSADWLPMLATGSLVPTETLCGACAAGGIVRSLEQRGLVCEALVPPRGGADGMMSGAEV